jgi:hypothetical protein
MNFGKLTKSNIIIYAIKNYNNDLLSDAEAFKEDYSRVKYIKRLFGKFQRSANLQKKEKIVRLLLNHVIILYNVFGMEAATRILFATIPVEMYPFLKPFLISQGYIDPVKTYKEWGLDIILIPLNQEIVTILRELLK